jgi:5'-nucleotidase (lipoprotein e(P4) family)
MSIASASKPNRRSIEYEHRASICRTAVARRCAIAIAAGFYVCALSLPAAQAQSAGTAQQTARPAQDHALRALLWMRTSGEYEALCRQIYNSALEHVRRQLQARTAGRPPAVIMDLDETVLDNSAYQAYLSGAGAPHSQARWLEWQSANVHKIGLVPGAREFIQQAEQRGVHVAFITNRPGALREPTIKLLAELGLARSEDLTDPSKLKLLMRADGRSKDDRRAAVMAKYDVIALFGDNLNDFSDDFGRPATKTIGERRAAVLRHAEQWGTRWFVLPNPVYGDWMRFIDWDRVQDYFARPRR